MDRNQKAAVIEEVTAQIQEAEAVFAVDYRGTSVPAAAELRTRLRDADASFRVVKNTLSERAADNAGADGLKEFLSGPTAMAFVRGDAAAAAKALNDFARTNGTLQFKGGWMNGKALSADEIVSISRLPSREVLYGQLVGMVASPLTGLAAAMGGLIGGLARQLGQIAEQGLVGGSAPAASASDAPAQDADATTGDVPEPSPEAVSVDAESAPGGDEAAQVPDEAGTPPADADSAEAATDVTTEASDETTAATDSENQE